jgi:hypothetical protein
MGHDIESAVNRQPPPEAFRLRLNVAPVCGLSADGLLNAKCGQSTTRYGVSYLKGRGGLAFILLTTFRQLVHVTKE